MTRGTVSARVLCTLAMARMFVTLACCARLAMARETVSARVLCTFACGQADARVLCTFAAGVIVL
ncbi:MAG: hypothetical protein GX096_13100 [Clostridiales bacterium]|nr:hypothetical protein [Clostridiales bacterium]